MITRRDAVRAAVAGGVGCFIPPSLRLDRVGAPDSGRWALVRSFTFYSAKLGRAFTVPKGFHTDLASVPRLPLMYWLCGATADEAAVIHDFLYATQLVTRAQADDVFAEAIGVIQREQEAEAAAAGVPAWRRKVKAAADRVRRGMMWAGVRVGGASHWRAPKIAQPEAVDQALQQAG